MPELTAAVTRLEDLGFTPVGIYTVDPAWQEVFLHPRETGGVLLQLAQGGLSGAPEGITQDDVLAGRVDGTGRLREHR